MRIHRGLTHLIPSQGCVATIGNFDGLHRGHQAILQQVREHANALGVPATVISFEPLPLEFFKQPPPPRIYGLRDKLRLLSALQVDQFVCLPFNAVLASMPAEAFVQSVLFDALNVRYLVVGDDFRFGQGRTGDFALLQKMGQAHGMHVVNTATCQHDGIRISSTRIREALAEAKLDDAAMLLGRCYQVSGRVRHGDKRGRTLGFPTLNLRVPQFIALRKGVYAVKVMGLGEMPVLGVANLGVRPTVQGTENRLEIHLFEFNQMVYGQHICVEPVAFVRDEMKFSSLDALKSQIASDVNAAQMLLK